MRTGPDETGPVQYRSNWFRSGPDRVPGPIVTFPVLQFASNLLSSSGENPAIRPGTTIRAILEGTKFCQNFQNFAETASSAPFLPSVSSFLIFGPGTRSTNFGPVRTGPNPLDRSGPTHLYRSSSLTPGPQPRFTRDGTGVGIAIKTFQVHFFQVTMNVLNISGTIKIPKSYRTTD